MLHQCWETNSPGLVAHSSHVRSQRCLLQAAGGGSVSPWASLGQQPSRACPPVAGALRTSEGQARSVARLYHTHSRFVARSELPATCHLWGQCYVLLTLLEGKGHAGGALLWGGSGSLIHPFCVLTLSRTNMRVKVGFLECLRTLNLEVGNPQKMHCGAADGEGFESSALGPMVWMAGPAALA